ncbi:MAG TPA: PD-(D/E)XK nuclease superfamily protein [Coleofasciculaceae cyanobacterium]
MNQGGRAVISGNVLEKTVEVILQSHGYVEICRDLPKKRRRDWLVYSSHPPKRYAKQVYIGLGIYGTDIYVDFYIFNDVAFPTGLIIECKWQQSGGSVDEKLPYLNLNIQNCYPSPAMVLIEGEGMKKGAIDWLTRQVISNGNLLAVYNLSHFMIWANNHL